MTRAYTAGESIGLGLDLSRGWAKNRIYGEPRQGNEACGHILAFLF
jgi:hypothetical protein